MTKSLPDLPAELTHLITESDAINAFRAAENLPDEDCDISMMIRDSLISDFESMALDRDFEYLRDLFEILREAFYILSTQTISLLKLDYSLCPMHSCDYAICFDDDDSECATIRAYFPNHDT